MVVLDTNIIIDHLRLQQSEHESRLMTIVRVHKMEEFGLSTVSIQELYEGKSTMDNMKEQQLLATVSPLTILSYTYEIAKLAGEIARDLPRPITLADAAIAATAIANKVPLYTLNAKDFTAIPGLQLFAM